MSSNELSLPSNSIIQGTSCEMMNPYALAQAYVSGKIPLETSQIEPVVSQCLTKPDKGSLRSLLPVLFHQGVQVLFNPQKGRNAFRIGEKHYDLGNTLFTAMLDSSMSYTCGLWQHASSLCEAQEAKLKRLCEKLELQPGMHVLDIGCGWGNFAEFAASNFGVSVTGLTVSKEQAELARTRCTDLPVEILLQDYRSFSGSFDRIVSIEMIEAVGRKNLPFFFTKVENLLKPQGIFCLQAISGESFTLSSNRTFDSFVAWIRQYIFPDGYLPRLDELSRPHRKGLTLLELHDFAPDYTRTLRAWQKNFNNAWPELSKEYPESFRRMWNFYLGGCAAAFKTGFVQLYQLKYQKS